MVKWHNGGIIISYIHLRSPLYFSLVTQTTENNITTFDKFNCSKKLGNNFQKGLKNVEWSTKNCYTSYCPNLRTIDHVSSEKKKTKQDKSAKKNLWANQCSERLLLLVSWWNLPANFQKNYMYMYCSSSERPTLTCLLPNPVW